MFSNYLKIAWRNLLRNKLVSSINIGGLGIGLAVAFIVMAWITDEVSYNKFHKNLAHINVIMQTLKQGGDLSTTKSVPGPLATKVRLEVPEVKYAARVSATARHLIAVNDKVAYEGAMYAEPDYFRIMTFPAVYGNPVATLSEANAIVITESLSKKLYGNENPVGRIIQFDNQSGLTIGAVIKDIPANSTYTFDAVLPFTMFEKENSAINSWNNNFISTWVQLQPGAKTEQVNQKLTRIIRENSDSKTADAFAYPLAKIAMHDKFKNGKPEGGRMNMLIMMGALGLFVLIIACVNFMNLSTARSERRAKEVGIRKTVGALRKNLIMQFLIEAILVTILSLIAAVTAAQLLLPGFNSLTGKQATLDLSDWKTSLFLFSTALFTALISGVYPAFFLSRFLPVKVLKGVVAPTNARSLLRKGLVTFQFVISSFLIIVTIVIYKQVEYGQDFPVGYNQKNLVDIQASGDIGKRFELFRTLLMQQPGIESVSGASHNMVAINSSSNGFQWPGKQPDQDFAFSTTNVQYDWSKTTGVKIIEGRDFTRGYGSDSLACILNQAAVKRMDLKEPVIGKMINDHKIIGIAADFVYNDLFASPGPLIAFLDTGSVGHVFIRLHENADRKQSLAGIGNIVKRFAPGYPFEYRFTEEVYESKFTGIRSGGQFSSMIGILAILISCMGLFALSMFIAERRTKEIGVRKVLGASASRIWLSLSKDFLKPVFLAFIITVPLAGFVMQKVLSSMEHHISLSWWIFALAGIIVMTLALVIVSFQAIKAAVANPVKNLRTE